FTIYDSRISDFGFRISIEDSLRDVSTRFHQIANLKSQIPTASIKLTFQPNARAYFRKTNSFALSSAQVTSSSAARLSGARSSNCRASLLSLAEGGRLRAVQ